MYERILVAVDGSDHSTRAVQNALQVAKLSPDTVVTLLNVIDYDKTRGETVRISNELVHEERFARLQPLRDILLNEGIKNEVKLLHGEAGPLIVEHANNEKYDLVIIGSRGLNSFQEMVLGSVSHKVAKRVHAPVMLVK